MGKGQLSQVTKRKGQFKEPCVSPFRQGLQTPQGTPWSHQANTTKSPYSIRLALLSYLS